MTEKQKLEYSKDWTFNDFKKLFKGQNPFMYKGESVNVVEYGARLAHTGSKVAYANLSNGMNINR